jgi:hypothetical protein
MKTQINLVNLYRFKELAENSILNEKVRTDIVYSEKVTEMLQKTSPVGVFVASEELSRQLTVNQRSLAFGNNLEETVWVGDEVTVGANVQQNMFPSNDTNVCHVC